MKTELSQIIHRLETEEIIQRYRSLNGENVLDVLNYANMLSKFNWSTYVTIVSNKSIESIVMQGIELLGLTARIIDDIVDKDSPLTQKYDVTQLSLLTNELLVRALQILSNLTYFDFEILRKTFVSEFNDANYSKSNNEYTLDTYFEKVIWKSIGLFTLASKIGSQNNEILNDFSYHYGTYLQIKNDIAGYHSDLQEGRCNMIVIAAATSSKKTLAAELRRCIEIKKFDRAYELITVSEALPFFDNLMKEEKLLAIKTLRKLDVKVSQKLFIYLELE